MPFIGNAGQFSNIHEKNYATTTLRVVEGDALYQAYNPADSHYKLITTLQEVTTIGSVTANTIQFTNPITSLVTSSNIGVANAQPMHTLDVGANVYIDDLGSNTIYTSGTTYSSKYKGETADITDSVTTRDTIVDKIFPKTNGYVRFMSNVGVLNTAPIHTLDIGANVQIDEYGSNTFYTSGNVHANKFTGDEITLTGTIVTGEIECSSHLTVGGNISGNGDAVFRKYTIASPGSGQYSVIGPGFSTATVNPTLTLMRGQKYVFDNTVHNGHPLEIRNGYQGSVYTPGVIGNGTATITFTVPMDAPIKLYYQCTLHAAMGNIIYIPESTLDTTLALNLSNNLVVTGTSNVGIGTANPRALLDVCGPVSVPAILTSGAGSSEGDIAVISGEAMQIGHWDVGTTTFTNRIHVTSGGNVGIGSSSPSQKLDVDGSIQHKGLVTTSGTNIDQITSITRNLGVTVSWMDTGISGTDLVTGSYIVQIENHSDPSSGTNRNYNEYYTGFMSWYSESNGTNDTDASEIILHAAGYATEDNHIYLRVLRQLSSVLKLQIRRDFDRSGSGQNVDYKFKFRRMM